MSDLLERLEKTQSGLGRRERREISRSTASRMNSARLFGPASSSMRDACASVRRTSVGFVADLALSGGRPMRAVVADIGMSVNSTSKAISLIDLVSDIAYKGNIGAHRRSDMLKVGEKLWNGAIVTEALVATYNALNLKIEAIEREGRQVPDHLLNGRHNLISNVLRA